MEATKEVGIQERPRHGIVSEKITPFKEKLSPRVVELMTADRTKEKDYKVEERENQYTPGIIHITETWDGGLRQIRKFDERYETRNVWDNKPGDLDVSISVGQGYSELEIKTNIKANGSLIQEINCSTEIAQRASFREEPLMKGEFFKYAGQGKMTEKVSIAPDGKVSTWRLWSEDKWLGRNERHQMRIVIEDDGVVKSGVGEHGIMLGYIPKMEVVSSPTKK